MSPSRLAVKRRINRMPAAHRLHVCCPCFCLFFVLHPLVWGLPVCRYVDIMVTRDSLDVVCNAKRSHSTLAAWTTLPFQHLIHVNVDITSTMLSLELVRQIPVSSKAPRLWRRRFAKTLAKFNLFYYPWRVHITPMPDLCTAQLTEHYHFLGSNRGEPRYR